MGGPPAGRGSRSELFRRERVAAGLLLGPRIYTAGPAITVEGGHPVALVRAIAPWWLGWYLTHISVVRGLLSLAVVALVWEVAGRSGRWPLILAPLSEIGARFRDEILARGGSRTALESFVAFRGRPPQLDALLRHNGMVET